MVDIIVPILDITCVNRSSYGYTKRESTYRLPAVKGRPRYRLRDSYASYTATVQFEYTPEQYGQFLDFWFNELEAGLGEFLLELMLDDADFYNSNFEVYRVHATAPYQAAYNGVNLWTVSIPIEIQSGFRSNIFDCPVIYGGPIQTPAPDFIYGGPVSSLAADVIVPCGGILP